MIVLDWIFFDKETNEHTAGEELRDRMLAAFCGIHDAKIARAPGGKPYLAEHPAVSFSVSHTADLAVCALSFPGTAEGAHTVLYSGATAPVIGVDAERVRPAADAPRLRRIAARFFSPELAARIAPENDCAYPRAFCAAWTSCESYVKMTGSGFGGGFSALDFGGIVLPQLVLRRGDAEYIVRAAWRKTDE